MGDLQKNIADVVGMSLSSTEVSDSLLDVVGMSDFEKDLNGLDPNMEDALLQHILKTRNVIATTPRLIENQQNSTQMLQMYNYLIENWEDIRTRVVAIKILAIQEKELVAKGFISYNVADLDVMDVAEHSGFFSVLASLYEEEISQLDGLDGFWSKLKSKVKKATNGIVKIHKKVFDAHKKAFKKVVDIHKKGIKKFVKILPKLNKFNPLTIAVRNAFRGLLIINFLGMASILNDRKAKERGVLKKVEKLYNFMGGKHSKLCSAIKKGAKKKALFNKKYQRQLESSKTKKLRGFEDDYNYDNYGEYAELGSLGEPFTIGAMLTAAGSFLLKVWSWIKKAGLKIKKIAGKGGKLIKPLFNKNKPHTENAHRNETGIMPTGAGTSSPMFLQKQNDSGGHGISVNNPTTGNDSKKWKKPLIIGGSIVGVFGALYVAYKLSKKDEDAPKTKLAGIVLQ